MEGYLLRLSFLVLLLILFEGTTSLSGKSNLLKQANMVKKYTDAEDLIVEVLQIRP